MDLNTSTTYTVKPNARYSGGPVSSIFPAGSKVTLTRASVDGDGDVYAETENGKRNYILPEYLFEEGVGDVVQITAVRAALVALGIEADVVAVAQAIEAATA